MGDVDLSTVGAVTAPLIFGPTRSYENNRAIIEKSGIDTVSVDHLKPGTLPQGMTRRPSAITLITNENKRDEFVSGIHRGRFNTDVSRAVDHLKESNSSVGLWGHRQPMFALLEKLRNSCQQ